MKKITLLVLALMAHILFAQNNTYVPPKLDSQDSMAAEAALAVFDGKVIQSTDFYRGKGSFKRYKIRVYSIFKDKIGIKDTVIEAVTPRDSKEMHAASWNPEIGAKATFFVWKSEYMKTELAFMGNMGEFAGLKTNRHNKEAYIFNYKYFANDNQMYQYLAQMKSLSIPDSLTNEETYSRRVKRDSLERVNRYRKAMADEKKTRRLAMGDSSIRPYDTLSPAAQAEYHKKHNATRDSIINAKRIAHEKKNPKPNKERKK